MAWILAFHLRCQIWVEWVDSGSNWADDLSRDLGQDQLSRSLGFHPEPLRAQMAWWGAAVAGALAHCGEPHCGPGVGERDVSRARPALGDSAGYVSNRPLYISIASLVGANNSESLIACDQMSRVRYPPRIPALATIVQWGGYGSRSMRSPGGVP